MSAAGLGGVATGGGAGGGVVGAVQADNRPREIKKNQRDAG